jgi:triosephosphate isomerase (TIM)
MKKIVVANWKMLPETLGEAEEILARTDEWLADVKDAPSLVVCPPGVFMEEVAQRLREGHLAQTASLGAQDILLDDAGASLAALGVRYVIIGHSDRRWKIGESNETVNAKLRRTLEMAMMPIVCLGERTREGDWQSELQAQTEATFAGVPPADVSRCLIAYEPVWAISTNPGAKPDTPARAVQAMSLIRETLADRFMVSHTLFLYGGSVTPQNVRAFLERPEISGILVGGASVRPNDLCEILSIASQ